MNRKFEIKAAFSFPLPPAPASCSSIIMGLSEIEQILARLSTDEKLRERFVNDPHALGRELGLTAAESRRLKREADARLNSFITSGRERRFLEISKLLPLTRRVLEGRFDGHLNRYEATHEHGGIERLFGDAIAFAVYLDEKLREERIGSGWTLELLRYEKARLKAADPKRRLVAAFFRHDISRLVRSVARKDEHPTVVKRATLALWMRSKRHEPVRYAAFSTPKIFGGRS
jgi:hypothetical protein